MRSRVLLAFVALVVPVLILSACAPAQPTAVPTKPPSQAAPTTAPQSPTAAPAAPTAAPKAVATPTAAAKVKRGGTIRTAIQNDVTHLDTHINTGSSAAIQMIYDPLVFWQQDDKGVWGPAPGLAESWDLQAKDVTFKLRKGIKFQDGSGFDAKVVKFLLERAVTHPKSVAKADLECVDPKGVTIIDDYTVKVGLKSPCASLLAALSSGTQRGGAMMSMEALQKAGDKYGMPGGPAVGTGPMQLVEWKTGSNVTLKKWDGYWQKGTDGQPLPYLDGIVYRYIADDSVRLLEMKAGSLDFVDLIQGKDVASVKSNPDLVYLEVPWVGNHYNVVFNSKTEPFGNNLKLRQAIAYATDREAIAKTLGMGSGIPSKYLQPPGSVAYNESAPYYWYDLDKAKKLVADAGFPNGVDFELTVHSRQIDSQQAQMLKSMWEKVGLRATLNVMERTAWVRIVREAASFQAATRRGENPTDPDMQMSLFWASEGSAAYHRASIPEMDKCLEEARSTYDPKARNQIYVRCETIDYETAWLVYFWYQPWNYVMSKSVKGFPPSWGGFWEFRTVWLDR
ncbi:MAG: ABC transporter substrate-binding protein [Bacteroidetes bacterium]|nr:ABC transporter substrate-binding protein [Bacteroidota bacterium]MCL5025131.1 ABC transporter substrate-binding protein [Chloroflexota bacterium]